MGSLIFQAVLGFFGSKKNLLFVVFGLVVFLGLLWLWGDYRGAKARALLYEQKYQQSQSDLVRAVDANRANIAQFARQKKQYENSLEQAAQVAENRLQEMQILSSRLTKIERIERPENEKKCPIHPAIIYAIEQLRGSLPADSGEG